MGTTDGGRSWVISSRGDNNESIDFFGETGWVSVDFSGTAMIIQTTNGGNSWIMLAPVGNLRLSGISFVSTTTGWMVGREGVILKTTNGGDSWDVEASGTTRHLNSVYFATPTTGWAVGDGGTILRYVSTTGVESGDRTVSTFRLYQNYPNPANPSTVIRYTLPDAWKAGRLVSLRVYNARGQLLRTLMREWQSAGSYTVIWDGKNDSQEPLPSGIYFYELRAGSYQDTRKVILLH